MLVFALVVVVLLVLAGWLLVKGIQAQVRAAGEGSTEMNAAPTEAVTEDPAAPAPAESEASGMCPTDEVSLSGRPDKESYAHDATVTFEYIVKNEHSAACRIAVGTNQQEYMVKHDGKVVWTTRYCADPAADGDAADVEQVFAAGSEKRSSLQWNRIPVDENCNRTADTFEPGDYQLVVKLGDTESEAVDFVLEEDPAVVAEREEKERREREQAEAEAEESAAEESAAPEGEDGADGNTDDAESEG